MINKMARISPFLEDVKIGVLINVLPIVILKTILHSHDPKCRQIKLKPQTPSLYKRKYREQMPAM